MSAPLWLVWILAAFVLGSIPFGLIIGRAHGIDIRAHGSKNIGATNVGRVLGRKWGFLCFALDALKGATPILLILWTMTPSESDDAIIRNGLLPLAGAAAIFGHLYSPWVSFKGGKGVATSFGALVSMWPTMTFAALGALVIWLLMMKAFRYVSLASMCAAGALPLLFGALSAWPFDDGAIARLSAVLPLLLATVALAILVVVKHRANIARLRAGTESRVGGPKPPHSATVRS